MNRARYMQVEGERLKKLTIEAQFDALRSQINPHFLFNCFNVLSITGGLMLGRKHDDLGKVLLVTGGVTGITGTFMMVDAFKYLGRAARSRTKN